MKRPIKEAVLASAASACMWFTVMPAHAASFDCNAASKRDELAICGNASLSAMDSEMGGLWYAYSRVPMLMGGNGDRRDEAHDFLLKRASCGSDTICLRDAYRDRIAALKRDIDGAMRDVSQQENGTPDCPPH
jgi:uncharacterized protein